MSNSRDTFIFYRSFIESMSGLSDIEKLALFEAICLYSLDQKEPNLSGHPKSLFVLIRPILDANTQRWINGKKGGAPKGNINKKGKGKSTENQPRINQTSTENQPRINQTSTGNQPNKDKSVDKYTNISTNVDKEYTTNVVLKKDELSSPSNEKFNFIDLMNSFNTTFSGKLSSVKSMTEPRKKAVKARISQYGVESISEVFQIILKTDFLLGANDRNWKCDFDWIFKQQNFTKILEGNYERKRSSTFESANSKDDAPKEAGIKSFRF